ncbi:hypothetical protein [Treponema pectinovorum]|uniref:hypothetical protein n=1 Tax=Treponema pectinovorum TaxID=164 RepID=UPI003D9337D5
MKKIIGTVLLAVTGLSLVAADVTVNINSRVRPNLYTTSKKEDGKKTSELFKLDGAKAADTVKIAASNAYAGAVLESTWDAGAAAPGVELDNYYGWMNFGNLAITAGKYDSRYTARFNSSATEGGLVDSDIAKYGLSNKIATGLNGAGTALKTVGKTWLYDFDNASAFKGSKDLSLTFAYTLADVAGGKLLLKASLVKNAYDTYTNSDGDTFTQSAGYVAEAAWNGKGLTFDFIFKNPENKGFGVGLYSTVKINDNNSAAVGVTYGTKKDELDTALAVDGRYKFTSGPLAATLAAKYSYAKPKGFDAETALEAGTEVSYMVNNLVTVALDARLDMCDLDDNDKKDLAENVIVISPRAKFTAGKGAAVTVAVEYTQALNSSKDVATYNPVKTKIGVPVIFRVKM